MTSTTELVVESFTDLTENKKTFKEMTIKEKYVFIKDLITLEPLILCYLVPLILRSPAVISLEYEKSCKSSEYFNDTVCDAILLGDKANYSYENQLVQERIANLHSWNEPIHSIVPLILMIFIGSYSDRYKLRKPFLLLPLIGDVIISISFILNVIFMKEISLEAFGVLNTIISSMFGGESMVVIMIFAYMADISTVETRTLKFGITTIIISVCFPLVHSFSAPLFKQIGYIAQFSIVSLLYLFGLFYGVVFLKEPRETVNRDKSIGLLWDIFAPKHILSTFSLLIKKDSKNNRSFVIMLMVLMLFTHGIGTGESSLFYLYAQLRYNWTVIEYFYFLTYSTIIHALGTLIAIPICTKLLKLSDFTIILIGFVDKIITNFIYIFSSTAIILYIGCSVNFIYGIALVGVRSLATKVVSEDDLGKTQTLFALCEAIGAAAAAPIYNQSYKIMIQTFPSGYFIYGVVIFSLSSLLILYMFFIDKAKVPEEIEKNACDNKDTKNIQEKAEKCDVTK